MHYPILFSLILLLSLSFACSTTPTTSASESTSQSQTDEDESQQVDASGEHRRIIFRNDVPLSDEYEYLGEISCHNDRRGASAQLHNLTRECRENLRREAHQLNADYLVITSIMNDIWIQSRSQNALMENKQHASIVIFAEAYRKLDLEVLPEPEITPSTQPEED